jgi:hypothetical protein
MGKAEREQRQESARALEQPSRLGQYIVGALHDIHRRVIEEGWFGKTVHDVVDYYHYNPRRDPNQTMRDDDVLHGRNQAEEEQDATLERDDDDLGMER